MSNIVADIVEDIQIKPSKLKLVLKWVISLSVSAVVVAFTFGQVKATRLNKLDYYEKVINENTAAMVDLRAEMKVGFQEVNARIDKVYDDGFRAFTDFQELNNKQLGMIIDYGKSDKEMLKRMLEITSMEKTQAIETQVEQAKNTKSTTLPESQIVIRPLKEINQNKGYISLVGMAAVGTNDTIYQLTGATKEYINKIDRNRYNLGAVVQNQNNPGLYDVNYTTKKQ